MKYWIVNVKIFHYKTKSYRDYIVKAITHEKAVEKAHNHFKDFYGQGKRLEMNSYEFDDGYIVEIKGITEIDEKTYRKEKKQRCVWEIK